MFFIGFVSLHAQTVSEDSSSVDAEEKETAAVPELPPEDFPYLIDAKLGDLGVNFLWDGYWRLSFVAGASIGDPSKRSFSSSLSPGAQFFQEPDLTLSLWLNSRWFLETTVVENFDHNTYRVGYQGQSDEFVQSVIFGNAGVSGQSYAEILVPTPRYNTPGISADFKTEKSRHEILVRYDPTETQTKIFQGSYEIKSEDIALSDFLEGQYFLLPDTDVSNVAVYLEDQGGSITGLDDDGTVRRYRLAQTVEYAVDRTSGTVVLDSSHDGRVLVYYDNSSGNAVGTDPVNDFVLSPDANFHPDIQGGTFEPFDFNGGAIDPYDPAGRFFDLTSRVILSNGDEALILYAPGRFTPFERQNVYRSSRPLPEETWRIVPLLRDRGALYPSGNPNFGWIPTIDEKTIAVYGAKGAVDGLRNPANRYPFAASDPQIYGPGREVNPSKISQVIVLALREKNTNYSLGTGIVPDSVLLRVNGVRDKNFELSSGGNLIFNNFIFPDDWIEVNYRTETLGLDGGDLFAYQGNRLELGPRLNLEWAESLRWNLSSNSTGSTEQQSPGEISVASTLDWKADNTQIRLTGDGTLRTPNTVENLRLYGMEEGRLNLLYFSSLIHPAPSSLSFSGSYTPLDKYSYTSTTALGRELLHDYSWSTASSTGDEGPALTASRSNDPVSSRLMEGRFDLSTTQWTAGDALADPLGPINLSPYVSMEFPILFLNDHGTDGLGGTAPDFYLQIGEIGESEDHHNEGVINSFDLGQSVERNLTTDSETSSTFSTAWNNPGVWQSIRLTFNPDERARLGSVRSWRFVLENSTGNPVSGRFITGPLRFNGSSFRAEIRSPANTLVAAQDVVVEEVSADDLKIAFPEVIERFHPDNQENQALRLRWGDTVPQGVNLDPLNRWETVSWYDGVPLENYRRMVFYLRSPAGSATGPLRVQVTDEAGQGVDLIWTPNSVNWDRLTVNMAQGTASSANAASISSLSVDKNAGDLSRFILSGSNDAGVANRSGELFFDEIHFRDPAFALTGGGELWASWQHKETILSINDFPLIEDVTVNVYGTVDGAMVFSGLDKGSVGATGSADIKADILGIGLDAHGRIIVGLGRQSLSGSHALRIPAQAEKIWMDEIYARGERGLEKTLFRRNALNLKLDLGNFLLYSEALYDTSSLVQSWGTSTAWGAGKWRAQIDADYILNTEGSLDSSKNYFSAWIRGYKLLAPVKEDVSNREAHHVFSGGWAGKLLSPRWNAELRMKAQNSPNWNQENRWASHFFLPFQFSNGWSLTPSYHRDLRQVVNTESSGLHKNYGDSWDVFTQGMQQQFPLFSYLPFRELWGHRDGIIFMDATQGMQEVSYETEFELNFTRQTKTNYWDLLIPSSGDFSMKRDYRRKGDTVGWENEWRGNLHFNTSNLFGRFGRYPIFSFYNTEEIKTLLQLTFDDFNGVFLPSPKILTWQSDLFFTANRGRSFVFDHSLTWNWEPDQPLTRQEARLEFWWRTDTKDALRLPLIKRVIPRQHYVENKEKIVMSGKYPWSDKQTKDLFDIEFIITHESRWVFQNAGHLKTWLSIGLGRQEEQFTNAFELGVEIEVNL